MVLWRPVPPQPARRFCCPVGQRRLEYMRRYPQFIAWALTVTLVGVFALGYASPPEPTWIPGIYDNADYDNVVWLVTDEVDARHNGTAARVQYAPIGLVSLAARGPVPSPIVSQHASRGPPIEVRAALVCLQPTLSPKVYRSPKHPLISAHASVRNSISVQSSAVALQLGGHSISSFHAQSRSATWGTA